MKRRSTAAASPTTTAASYATNGLGFVAALDVRSGGIVWQVRPGGPLRGAPTVANDAIYVMSQDNQIYSLKESDGSTNWSQAASLEIAGVFGSASPAVGQGTVVAGFSSGELNAYRYENGRQVWQDALQRTSIRTSVSSLSDIDADPVIDHGQVFAIGQGGRMVALELTTGQRQWELNIAGIATPWVAGDWVFVVTDDAKLLCISRSNGHIRWINQLPQFEHPKAKKGEIDYTGPVLAGGRLIVVGSNGAIDLCRSGDRQFPEPDQRRRRHQPVAGGRQFDALHLRRRRPAARLPLIPSPRSDGEGRLARSASGVRGWRRHSALPSPFRRFAAPPARSQGEGAANAAPCPSPPSPSSAGPTSANRRCSTGSSASAWRWSTTGPE